LEQSPVVRRARRRPEEGRDNGSRFRGSIAPRAAKVRTVQEACELMEGLMLGLKPSEAFLLLLLAAILSVLFAIRKDWRQWEFKRRRLPEIPIHWLHGEPIPTISALVSWV